MLPVQSASAVPTARVKHSRETRMGRRASAASAYLRAIGWESPMELRVYNGGSDELSLSRRGGYSVVRDRGARRGASSYGTRPRGSLRDLSGACRSHCT